MKLDKPTTLLLLTALLSGSSASLAAQSDVVPPVVAPVPVSGIAQVAVKSTQIAEIDSNRLRIAVDLSAIPSRTITLENLRLTGLRLNGLPVYAEPLAEPIELIKGKETALPPLYITLQTRDITSTKPLREMVENQSVHLTGQMVAALKVSFIEKLALHTEHPRIALPVAQEVPVAFSASPFARQAALGALTVIDLALQGTSIARKTLPGFESPWVKTLETQANTSLMTVETSFLLKEKTGQFPVVFEQLGFRLASGQVVTTAESKAPWEYDSDFLARIKSGEAKLEKKSVEIQLKPSGQPEDAPLLLTRKDFSLDERGRSSKDPLIIAKGQPDPGGQVSGSSGIAKISVRRRAEPDALIVMVLQTPPPTDGFHAVPAAIAQQDSWEKVALYRLNLDPTTGKPSVEVVQLSAHRNGQVIRLDESVDPAFYGSPIVVPEGVLGIVQDEQAGAFLPADLATASP